MVVAILEKIGDLTNTQTEVGFIMGIKKETPTCLDCDYCIKANEKFFLCNLSRETWYFNKEICGCFEPVKFVTLMKRKANIEINS